MRKAISLLAVLVIGAPAAAQNGPAAPVVQVAYVAKAEVAPTVAVPGTINSRNDMQVTAGVAGQLTMVAEPGTYVRAGDAIARIDKTPLQLQRAEQEVLLQRAEINVRQLNSQLRRQRELQGSNLVSEFELEQTEANRDLAEADAQLTRVRLRQIDDQIRRADVRAPFAGVVIERTRRAGEDVARGEALGQLTDIRNMEVRAYVPLKHLPRVSAGETISVFASEDVSHTGTIRSLVPTGDIRSQTFEARIELPAAASDDWTVGQLVSVGIPIRSGRPTLTVPRDALVLRQDGAFVFRINDDNTAERIAVNVGDSDGDRIGVAGELAPGDRVAIRGAENLQPGAEVRVMLSGSTVTTGSADS
ncbi:MAG: efflux RND transporter periplasmic adaptor subunit [Pseudomonadota bacterium]